MKAFNPAFLLIILAIFLSGCGGGSGDVPDTNIGTGTNTETETETGVGDDSGDMQSEGPSETNITSTSNVPDNLVSLEDSSVIVEASRRGVDLDFELLRTTFNCYYHVDVFDRLPTTDFSQPQAVVTFSGDMAETTFTEGGGVVLATLQDNENSDGFTLEADGIEGVLSYRQYFDMFGQWFEARRIPELAGCYQSGASNERAQHQFLLNTPEEGEYKCLVGQNGVVEAENVPLTLAANGQYTYDNATGMYRYGNIFEGASSVVAFDTGPLMNAEGEYNENANTGRQVLTASVDSFALQCERSRSPRPFKQFGARVIPPPERSSDPLSGLYFLGNLSGNSVGWLELSADGFFSTELPVPGGRNCQRSLPNGLAPCLTYVRNGATITIDNNGMSGTVPISEQSDGSIVISMLGHYFPVNTPSISELTGVWGIQSSTELDSTDISLCILGSCPAIGSSSMEIEFFPDGRFRTSSSASSTFVVNTPVAVGGGSASSQDSSLGTYSLDGPLLQINNSNGEAETPTYVHLKDENTLVVGSTIYRR